MGTYETLVHYMSWVLIGETTFRTRMTVLSVNQSWLRRFRRYMLQNKISARQDT